MYLLYLRYLRLYLLYLLTVCASAVDLLTTSTKTRIACRVRATALVFCATRLVTGACDTWRDLSAISRKKSAKIALFV